MIIVRLAGGLGNQMFQYAAGRAHSLRRGVPLKLDLSWFQGQTSRRFNLDCFRIAAISLSAEESIALLASFHANWFRKILLRIKQFSSWRSDPLYVVERNSRFDRRVVGAPGNVYLVGFWQSEKYFKDATNVIREDLSFKEPAVGRNADLVQRIQDCCSVAVHVRRGDYIANSNAYQVHGVCSPEYYSKATKRIRGAFPQSVFFVFSDDPVWTQSHLPVSHPVFYLNHNRVEQAWEDLRLMTHCRHHIIANSSFSWWGAWLATEPNKTVIAPKRWFADPKRDDRDIIPSSWVRIE
jgi:hypothetical protein